MGLRLAGRDLVALAVERGLELLDPQRQAGLIGARGIAQSDAHNQQAQRSEHQPKAPGQPKACGKYRARAATEVRDGGHTGA